MNDSRRDERMRDPDLRGWSSRQPQEQNRDRLAQRQALESELTVHRELLDHAIILNDRHLPLLLAEFLAYYQVDRTHLAFAKDTPVGRQIEPRPHPTARVVGFPRVGGLHRRYAWRQAA